MKKFAVATVAIVSGMLPFDMPESGQVYADNVAALHEAYHEACIALPEYKRMKDAEKAR